MRSYHSLPNESIGVSHRNKIDLYKLICFYSFPPIRESKKITLNQKTRTINEILAVAQRTKINQLPVNTFFFRVNTIEHLHRFSILTNDVQNKSIQK